jgi:hypothetical protein
MPYRFLRSCRRSLLLRSVPSEGIPGQGAPSCRGGGPLGNRNCAKRSRKPKGLGSSKLRLLGKQRPHDARRQKIALGYSRTESAESPTIGQGPSR